MAADSVAVNQPATTPITTMTMASRAQMDTDICLMKAVMLNLSPLG